MAERFIGWFCLDMPATLENLFSCRRVEPFPMMYSTVSPPNSRRLRRRYLDTVGNIWRFMIGLQWKKWLDRPRFYRIEFCLLAVGKTKKDLLVVLLDYLIINEKEGEGL